MTYPEDREIVKSEIANKIKNGYYYPFSNQATTIRNALVNELNKPNIKIEVLESTVKEKYYIDFFQTADTTYGYNQKAGG